MKFFGYRSREAAADAAGDPAHAGAADVKAAYQRGRRDERARRRRSPLLTLTVAAVALVGAGVLALAAREGSFSRGGQVVDHKLAAAADRAEATGRGAAAATGEAVRDAGGALRERAAPDAS